MGTHGRLGADGVGAAGAAGEVGRRSRRVEGKELAETEGKGSAVMAVAVEAGLVQMVAGLCGD